MLSLNRCCNIRILFFCRSHTNRILPLNRCYTRSPYFNFEKNVQNPFLGDCVGVSIYLLQHIANIPSKRGRCFKDGAFIVATPLAMPSSNWIFLLSIISAKFLCFAFGATSSSLSSFISPDCMFLSKSLSCSAIVFPVPPRFNCGTRNCILSQ